MKMRSQNFAHQLFGKRTKRNNNSAMVPRRVMKRKSEPKCGTEGVDFMSFFCVIPLISRAQGQNSSTPEGLSQHPRHLLSWRYFNIRYRLEKTLFCSFKEISKQYILYSAVLDYFCTVTRFIECLLNQPKLLIQFRLFEQSLLPILKTKESYSSHIQSDNNQTCEHTIQLWNHLIN